MKDALKAAGEMATIVRAIVGGTEITIGANIKPIDALNLSNALEKLRVAVDIYDEEIIKLMDKK
jgi:hypothetical protein